MAMVDEDCALFENDEWSVTADGLEHRRTGYFIDRADLGQRRDGALWDWPLHMAEKSWCAMAPFMEAFGRAAQLYGLESDAGLTRSFTIAEHDIAAWPNVAAAPFEPSEKASRTVADLLRKASPDPISSGPDETERMSTAQGRKGPAHHAYRVPSEHRNPRRSMRDRNGYGRTHSSDQALSGRAGIGSRLVRLLQVTWSMR